MKRWFIARMGDYENDGGLTPAAIKYPCNLRIWSKPGFGWCFGQLAAADLTGINADPDVYVLPDGALDMLVSAIPAGVRTTMTNKLQAAGFATSAIKNTWSLRQVLVYLLQQLQPALSTVEQGDVQDRF